MKKMVATIATGIIIAGVAATSVSAEQYEVKEGDNLWGIANEYNTTIDELVDINGLHTNVIQPKQTLVINEEVAAETYVVVKGDTLSRIAKEFDVTIGDIKEWNNLSSDLIIVGQELAVNGVHVTQEAPASDNTEVQTEEANTEVKPEEETKEEAPAEASNESANESTQAKEEPKAVQASEESTKQANTDNSPEGKTISVSATAYTAECNGCSGVTATGVDLNANPDAKVIAVDPNVIPLGSKVYVEGYGYATAADTGGAINGNKIDLHIPSKAEATNYGVQNVNVTIVE